MRKYHISSTQGLGCCSMGKCRRLQNWKRQYMCMCKAETESETARNSTKHWFLWCCDPTRNF